MVLLLENPGIVVMVLGFFEPRDILLVDLTDWAMGLLIGVAKADLLLTTDRFLVTREGFVIAYAILMNSCTCNQYLYASARDDLRHDAL